MVAAPGVDAFDGLFGGVYDYYIKHPALARPIGSALWGAGVGPMYEAMTAIRAAPPGATILDAPCGGGLAFRELRPGQDVRYVAIDFSEGMLERARREARRRGLDQVVLGAGPRPDRMLRYAQWRGSVGPAGTRDDLESWLRAAGLADVTAEASGAFAVFEARRPE